MFVCGGSNYSSLILLSATILFLFQQEFHHHIIARSVINLLSRSFFLQYQNKEATIIFSFAIIYVSALKLMQVKQMQLANVYVVY